MGMIVNFFKKLFRFGTVTPTENEVLIKKVELSSKYGKIATEYPSAKQKAIEKKFSSTNHGRGIQPRRSTHVDSLYDGVDDILTGVAIGAIASNMMDGNDHISFASDPEPEPEFGGGTFGGGGSSGSWSDSASGLSYDSSDSGSSDSGGGGGD